MKATTLLWRLLATGLFGLAVLVPMGCAYLYAHGPAWMLVNDGMVIVLTGSLLALLLMAYGILAAKQPED